MTKFSGASLAGATLCLAIALLVPASTNAQTQDNSVPAPMAPMAPPTPISPQVQTPSLQPSTQPPPTLQPSTNTQPSMGRQPLTRYITRSSPSSGTNRSTTSGASQPAAQPSSLPVYPSPVTPTPKLITAPPPPALNPTTIKEPTVEKPATVKHKTTKHKAKRHKTSHKKSSKKSSHATSGRSHIRAAQVYLDQLGYDPGAADGITGRKTKAAIKSFQHDHDLKATGTLTAATFAALEKEAGSRNPLRHSPEPPVDFVASHPDFYGYYGNEGVSPTSLASPQSIPTRFGDLQVTEQQNGSTSNYAVSMNGQQIYSADNQPSYINVSRTFQVDDADAVVLTSYNNGNVTCPYKHQLLIVKASGNNQRNIANCTRDYEAYTQNGMLMISFPGSHVDGYSTGDSWRYDHGTFEKL